ncbi:MAG TPA: DUF58 domain-containing protein [Anaerolineales bacterium]|nr:DUF58 domain-containing protein [Anaerolineales bacterium]
MQLNRKSLLLVFLIYGLILFALAARNGEMLLLVIPLLAYLIVGLAQAPTSMRLKATRTLDKISALAHEPIEVQISVENQGNGLSFLSVLDNVLPLMEKLDGETETQFALPTGIRKTFGYRFRAPRSIFIWEDVFVRASDPLGLFEVGTHIPAQGEVLVRPTSMPLRPLTLKPSATLHTAGPIPARLAGAGTDFWGVREFRPGDSFRWINWRLTNRHPNKMFTNEYEREEMADYGFILDARRLTDPSALEEEIFEVSVSAIAALSDIFLRTGNRVSLLALGKPILQVFPGSGKAHLNSLLVNLSHANLGGNIRFRNLDYFPTRLFPNRSLLLVFSLVGPRDLKAYSRMKAYGYDVLLVSPNLAAHAAQSAGDTAPHSPAYRAARIERTLHLKDIQKLGIQVIDWHIDQPLEPAVRKAARAMHHRRNT